MRRLATIRKIDEINPIEGADAIEVATVGGWKVVVKKGEYSAGDLAVYFEIDSWIPYELAPFLSNPDRGPREFEGVKGERLRTIKLRGQISQGLLLPMFILKSFITDYQQYHDLIEDDDVTDILGILKYERPMNAQLAGLAKGNFPGWGKKTDQERCQNLKKQIQQAYDNDIKFEVTIKLDGSSMSVGHKENEFVVCSRNLSLKLDQEGNSFVDTAVRLNILDKISFYGNIFISGELMGPGIQKNRENLTKHEFFVFDIFDVNSGQYMSGDSRRKITEDLGLHHVPVLFESITLKELGLDSIDKILAFAEGNSLNAKIREGVVFKSVDGSFSFKAISNSFLLKEDS